MSSCTSGQVGQSPSSRASHPVKPSSMSSCTSGQVGQSPSSRASHPVKPSSSSSISSCTKMDSHQHQPLVEAGDDGDATDLTHQQVDQLFDEIDQLRCWSMDGGDNDGGMICKLIKLSKQIGTVNYLALSKWFYMFYCFLEKGFICSHSPSSIPSCCCCYWCVHFTYSSFQCVQLVDIGSFLLGFPPIHHIHRICHVHIVCLHVCGVTYTIYTGYQIYQIYQDAY